MTEVRGNVHSFQSMGAVDGPGLRYLVFMQGCTLRCAYCHNPDTWEIGAGQWVTPEQVVSRVLRCLPYLKNGGVTVSGGEPLLQSDFVAALFALLHAHGIHTALDTAGIGNLDAAARVLAQTDLVLADVKFLTKADYRFYCRGDFVRVQEFLALTRRMAVPTWVRHVVVPGINDTPASIDALCAFLRDYPNVEKIELLGFQTLCAEKYEAMGIPFPMREKPALSAQTLLELNEHLRKVW